MKNIKSFSTTRYQAQNGNIQNSVLQNPEAITNPAIHATKKIAPNNLLVK
jgi:hypothetical protein